MMSLEPVMSNPPIRSAQYIRMSTENQRYSPGHQAAAIAAYAEARGYELVVTYADLGISGLDLKGRKGLQGLISDVANGQASYSTVLVYDVSRWGRFQDPDQSAHYEFLLREAGVEVEYCVEAFDNDGSVSSVILKLLKRVMAAEYSRDLSARVLRAQLRMAAKGFKMGGQPGYGLRRLLVDKTGAPICELKDGERNLLRSNRVLLIPGPPEEVATVRRIYRLFLYCGMRIVAIARLLDQEGAPYKPGERWTAFRVTHVLSQEKYAGVLVFNKTRQRLRAKSRPNPPSEWVRVEGALPAMVDRRVFDLVQSQLARRKRLSDEEMIDQLRALKNEKGRLTWQIINTSRSTPTTDSYIRRFGSMSRAFKLVDYEPGKRQRGRLSDEELLDDLRRIMAEHGRVDAKLLDATPWAAAPSTYTNHFGQLRHAYKLIGYVPLPHQRQSLCNEDLLARLAALYERHGKVSAQLMREHPETPSPGAYRRRFGSFEEACALVGFKSRRRPVSGRQKSRAKPRSTG